MAVAMEADANLLRLGGFSGPDIPDDDLLRACVHCGMCLSSCPTYRLTGQEMSSPRGRLWLMRAVADDRLDLLDPLFDEQMYQCLNCRACEAVCPSGVHYGPLVEASRAQLEMHRPRPLWQRVAQQVGMRWLFAQPSRLRVLTGGLRLYQRTKLDKLVRRTGVLKLMRMADMERLLPPIAGPALLPGRERWTPHGTAPATRQAQLFNGCVMGTVFADTNRAAARVMAHNGSAVDLPVGQLCCGALAVHAGLMDDARVLARQNIDAFAGNDAPVVTNAGGCGAMLASYNHLLAHDEQYAARAEAFSVRVRDVSQQLGATGVRAGVEIESARTTYDASCHLLHGQRANEAPLEMLRAVAGLEFAPLTDSDVCCGGAGVYNLLEPEMSSRVLGEKLAHIKETGAEILATGNPGCHMQIGAGARLAGLRLRVCHPVELLDESYCRAGFYDEARDT